MKTILIRAIIVSIIWVALFYNNNILFNYLLLHIIITAILFVRSPTAWLKPNFTILWIVSTLLLFGYIFELYVVHICYILFISFAILSSRRTTSQIHWIPAMSPLQYWYGIKGWWRTKSYIEICFKKKLGYQLPLKKLLVILPVAFPCVNIFCELLYISYPNIIWPYVFYGQFHLWHIFIFNEVSHLVFSGWSISNNPNIISISIGSKSYWTRQRDFQVNNDSFSIRLVFSLAKCFIAITLMYLLGAHFKEITYILKTIDTKEVSHISYSLRNTFSIQIFGFLGTSIIVFIDRFINRAGQGHYSLTTKAINIILLVLNLALISITVGKNTIYIMQHGITAERIQLLVWLGWCTYSIIHLFIMNTTTNDGWHLINYVALAGIIACALYFALPIILIEPFIKFY